MRRELLAEAQAAVGAMAHTAARDTFGNAIDWMLALEGRAKARQGRVTEGEADVRRALIGRLSAAANITATPPAFSPSCAGCWANRAGIRKQRKIAREIEGIYRQLGQADDSRAIVNARLLLASTLNMQRRYEDAAEIYRSVDKRHRQLATGPA